MDADGRLRCCTVGWDAGNFQPRRKLEGQAGLKGLQ